MVCRASQAHRPSTAVAAATAGFARGARFERECAAFQAARERQRADGTGDEAREPDPRTQSLAALEGGLSLGSA